MADHPIDTLSITDFTFDDHLLDETRRVQQPHMRIYLPHQPMVVLGRGSRAATELNLETCLADKIPIYRRRGGGCAVVLDPGNVVLSVVLPVQGFGGNQAHFRRLSAWLIAALEGIGFSGIQQYGVSDLTLNDRKIAGACIYRPLGLLYYSVSLLIAPQIELMTRYLRHPPREPAYRRQRPHDQFVGQLLENAPPPSIEAMAVSLRHQLILEHLQGENSTAARLSYVI